MLSCCIDTFNIALMPHKEALPDWMNLAAKRAISKYDLNVYGLAFITGFMAFLIRIDIHLEHIGLPLTKLPLIKGESGFNSSLLFLLHLRYSMK